MERNGTQASGSHPMIRIRLKRVRSLWRLRDQLNILRLPNQVLAFSFIFSGRLSERSLWSSMENCNQILLLSMWIPGLVIERAQFTSITIWAKYLSTPCWPMGGTSCITVAQTNWSTENVGCHYMIEWRASSEG